MKRVAKYREKPAPMIYAMRWTDDTPMADLHDFTDGLVRLNDISQEFFVYDAGFKMWRPFEYGDWVISDEGHFYPVPDDYFTNTYERVE